MIFLNLFLIGGLLAASAPIIVHILHRRRMRRIDWSAMRWLQLMLARQRRRIRIEHWLLLLLRIAALVMLALALMRPQWQASGDYAAIERQGAVAGVLLIDNSLTSGVDQDGPRLDALKDMALDYLDGLNPGDEVSIITRSHLGGEMPPPLYDLNAARQMIQDITVSELPGDIPRLLRAGFEHLPRHLNPQREVVLLSDGASGSWRQDARDSWSGLRRVIGDLSERSSRPPPQILLAQPSFPQAYDIAIDSVDIERNLIPVGAETILRARISHHGERPPGALRLRLSDGDGEILSDIPLELEQGSHRDIPLSVSFTEAGAQPLQLEVIGTRDDLRANDTYSLIIEAFQQLPVLVVEQESGPGLRGSGAFVALALQPDDEAENSPFAVTRINVEELAEHHLRNYRAIVLAGVGVLDGEAQRRIEQAVMDGTGLLVGLDSDADVAYINRSWARDGQGFLAAPLLEAQVNGQQTLSPAIALPSHPALSGLQGAGDAALHGAEISAWHKIDENAGKDLSIPLRWTNGDPALVLRRAGMGTSALLGCSLSLRHGRLPLVEGWAPLMRSLIGELASPIRPPRNLRTGDRLMIAGDQDTTSAIDPDGEVISLRPTTWEGRRVMASAALNHGGLYRVITGEDTQFFAVSSSSPSDGPQALTPAQRERLLAGLEARHLDSREAVQALTGAGRGSGGELWPWFILACLCLLLMENWYAARLNMRHESKVAA